jgi:hypothetical protein
METSTKKQPTWLYLLTAIVAALLIILAIRSCRNDSGEVPGEVVPPLSDTLESDTRMAPPPVGEDRKPADPADKPVNDTTGKTPAVYPAPPIGTPGTPGAAGPGGGGGASGMGGR